MDRNKNTFIMATVLLFVYVGFCFALSFLLGGCKSTHTITAGGEAEVRHVVDLDFSICKELPSPDKEGCIKALVELAASMAKEKEEASQ